MLDDDPLFLSGLDARAFAPRGAHAVFAAIPAPRRRDKNFQLYHATARGVKVLLHIKLHICNSNSTNSNIVA